MSLFVLSCKDGWVSIMYDGLDAVGVDQQVNTHKEEELLGSVKQIQGKFSQFTLETEVFDCVSGSV